MLSAILTRELDCIYVGAELSLIIWFTAEISLTRCSTSITLASNRVWSRVVSSFLLRSMIS